MVRRLGEIGERELLEWIVKRLEEPDGAVLPPGDDAADFPFRGRLVVSCDMLAEKTDIPAGMSLRSVGYKAVTAATSDIAAKAGKPIAYLISLMLPPDMSEKEFEELWMGFEEAVKIYDGEIIGGDLNSGDQIIIDVICIGEASNPVSRLGARPGDVLAVTGNFGSQAAGLHALLSGITDDPLAERVIKKFTRPIARLKEAAALAKIGAITSSIDSSDGLAESLHILSEVNDVGFVIDDPPVNKDAVEYSKKFGVNLFDLVFYGGEEYELVVTIKPKMLEDAIISVREVGGSLIPIGRVTEERAIKTKWFGREVTVERRGYEHFK